MVTTEVVAEEVLRVEADLRTALGMYRLVQDGGSVSPAIIESAMERSLERLHTLLADLGRYVTPSGRVLTDADCEALADEAEKGHPDLDAGPAIPSHGEQ